MTTPELDEEPHAADRPVAARKYTNSSVKELAANEYAHTEPLTTPVEQCFDWARELPDLVATSPGALEFYLVVFRSIRKSSANSDQLYSADAAAHDEARLSGGLLKYWYGILNERRECLAMCIWASRDEAVKAIHKPAHREAMKLAPVMYDMYTLERYSLRIDANLCPTFTLLGSMSS
ncbi:hypothetical protein M758_3G252600 [Ceratodon purpureus]|nr:hypothetical protein M758_3G252600 [Ceratodon purpureus]